MELNLRTAGSGVQADLDLMASLAAKASRASWTPEDTPAEIARKAAARERQAALETVKRVARIEGDGLVVALCELFERYGYDEVKRRVGGFGPFFIHQ